jgi:hypothetical protein
VNRSIRFFSANVQDAIHRRSPFRTANLGSFEGHRRLEAGGRVDLLFKFNQKDFVAAAKDCAHETWRPFEGSIGLRGETKR